MINPKILVTGATGKTGVAVVTLPVAKGYPWYAPPSLKYSISGRLWARGSVECRPTWLETFEKNVFALLWVLLHSGRCTELSGQRGATNF